MKSLEIIRPYEINEIYVYAMAKATAEARLLGLDFVDKNDNIEGLQIADFVPNCFARDHAGIKQCKPNIFGTLKYHRYDGGTGQADRFGVKYMP